MCPALKAPTSFQEALSALRNLQAEAGGEHTHGYVETDTCRKSARALDWIEENWANRAPPPAVEVPSEPSAIQVCGMRNEKVVLGLLEGMTQAVAEGTAQAIREFEAELVKIKARSEPPDDTPTELSDLWKVHSVKQKNLGGITLKKLAAMGPCDLFIITDGEDMEVGAVVGTASWMLLEIDRVLRSDDAFQIAPQPETTT